MNLNVGKYIGVYFAFGIGSAALVVVQTLILWIFCSIEVRHPDRAAGSRIVQKQQRKLIYRPLRPRENFMSEWPLPSSDPQCPFSKLPQLAAFSIASQGTFFAKVSLLFDLFFVAEYF